MDPIFDPGWLWIPAVISQVFVIGVLVWGGIWLWHWDGWK